MANNDFRNNIHENIDLANIRHRRQSILSSSDAKTDFLPIDCILVYNHNHKDDEIKTNDKSFMSRSERRRKFEDYLVKKQGLILQYFVCINKRIKIK